MTVDEALQVFDNLKAEGAENEDLIVAMYRMYQVDKLTFEEFENLMAVLGYGLLDSYKEMSDEERKIEDNLFNFDEELYKKQKGKR